MSQTSYSLEMGHAVAGMMADSGLRQVDSCVSVSSTDMAVGQGVYFSSVKAGRVGVSRATSSTAAFVFHGVIVDSPEYTLDDKTGTRQKIKNKDIINVMRKGRIWVKTGAAVTAGKKAAMNSSYKFIQASSNTSYGTAGNIDHGRYLTSAASGKLALLELF